MPRTGVICDVSGEELTDAECLACAHSWGKQQAGDGSWRHCDYSYPFINAWLHPYDRSKAGISTTMITGECTRKAWYEGIYDYCERPSKAHAALSGTGWHAFMDAHTEPEAIKEVRLVKRWRYNGKPRQITGQMDYYRPDLGILCDYKEKKEVFSRPPDNYAAQLNIYRWMIETGCVIQETGEVLQGKVSELYLFPKSHMGQLQVEVPCWELWQTQEFVNTVYGHFEQAEVALPPRGFEFPDRHPFCRGWCPFQHQCMRDGGAVQQPPYDIAKLSNLEL